MEIRNQTHPELKSRHVYMHHQQLATTISCSIDIRLLPVESALCLFSDQPHCSVIWVSLEAVTTSLLPRMRSATTSMIACASSVGWYMSINCSSRVIRQCLHNITCSWILLVCSCRLYTEVQDVNFMHPVENLVLPKVSLQPCGAVMLPCEQGTMEERVLQESAYVVFALSSRTYWKTSFRQRNGQETGHWKSKERPGVWRDMCNVGTKFN